jgi:hypothetical protein
VRECKSVASRTAPAGDRDRRTVRSGVSAEEDELSAVELGQGADRSLAAAPRSGQECPFGLDRVARRLVVDCRYQAEHARIVAPDLDGDHTLPGCRRHHVGRQAFDGSAAEAQPVESGTGDEEGIGLARVEAAPPGIDVAVERMDDEVRPSEQEPHSPWAVRPDPDARRQIVEPALLRVGPDDKRIARVRPGQVAADPKAWVLLGRDVFRALGGDVDATSQQRSLDRRDEGAVAPGRVRRPAIAVGLDRDEARPQSSRSNASATSCA